MGSIKHSPERHFVGANVCKKPLCQPMFPVFTLHNTMGRIVADAFYQQTLAAHNLHVNNICSAMHVQNTDPY